MIDCHMHTKFSPDSRQQPSELFRKAEELGLEYFAVTDHLENEYKPTQSSIDLEEYFDVFGGLKKAFPALNAAIGVEIGYAKNCLTFNKTLTDKYPFDYVINSVHNVDGRDCYYSEFFEGLSMRDAYQSYFECVLESLDAPYYFSAVGHFAYIARNAPFEHPRVVYRDFAPVIDKVLKRIIERGVIMELNSSVFRADTPVLPNPEILERYYSLGGRLINFGSDAHTSVNLGAKYAEVAKIARSVGFTQYFATIRRELVSFEI